jgi:DNA-binding MurR/RpiR family transcriptional regulator
MRLTLNGGQCLLKTVEPIGTSSIATFILRIRSHYAALSPAQKKLADYITASREVLPALDLKQLARKARVSSAIVTRFCRVIGFAGFHEFKMGSAQELVSLPLVFQDFDPSADQLVTSGPGRITRRSCASL